MQLNIKVKKKWQLPIYTPTPPFQGYPPFLAKFLVPPPPPPQVTQFFEAPMALQKFPKWNSVNLEMYFRYQQPNLA